jgi:hypothetical protein
MKEVVVDKDLERLFYCNEVTDLGTLLAVVPYYRNIGCAPSQSASSLG